MKKCGIGKRFWIGWSLLTTLLPAAQVAAEELKWLPFWACAGVDRASAESQRTAFFEALKSNAMQQLKASLDTISEYQSIYQQDMESLAVGHPDRQAARQQRDNFLKDLDTVAMLQQEADVLSLGLSQAHFVEMSIMGNLQYSAMPEYKDFYLKESINSLDALDYLGFRVVDGNQRVHVINDQITVAETIYRQPGLYLIDLNQDLKPYLELQQGEQGTDCWKNHRLNNIEATVQRDLVWTQSILAGVAENPILDVEVPGGGLRDWIFKPKIREILQKQDDPEWEYNFWVAMRSGLDVVRSNNLKEQDRIGAMRVSQVKDLAKMPLVRSQVLELHKEYKDIDCVVTNEWWPRDVGPWLAGGGQLVFSIGAGLFTAHGNVVGGFVCTLLASALGAANAYLIITEYFETSQGYLSAVQGYGLYPREVYFSQKKNAILAAVTTALDLGFTATQGVALIKNFLTMKGLAGSSKLTASVLREATPEEAAAIMNGDRSIFLKVAQRVGVLSCTIPPPAPLRTGNSSRFTTNTKALEIGNVRQYFCTLTKRAIEMFYINGKYKDHVGLILKRWSQSAGDYTPSLVFPNHDIIRMRQVGGELGFGGHHINEISAVKGFSSVDFERVMTMVLSDSPTLGQNVDNIVVYFVVMEDGTLRYCTNTFFTAFRNKVAPQFASKEINVLVELAHGEKVVAGGAAKLDPTTLTLEEILDPLANPKARQIMPGGETLEMLADGIEYAASGRNPTLVEWLNWYQIRHSWNVERLGPSAFGAYRQR